MRRTVTLSSVALLAVLVLGFVPGPASATTFCVPGFHAACPDNDMNVNEPSLEDAMDSLGDDGEPDKVIIGEGTISPAGSIFPQPAAYSDDPLEIVGAGTGKTRITSSTGGNIFVLNLDAGNFRQRHVTMRDLSIVVPPRNVFSSSGIQSVEDTFEDVDFISQDPSTSGGPADGAGSVIDGGVFRNVRFYGESGGRFGTAIETGSAFPGSALEIDQVDIADSGSAIGSFLPADLPVTVKSSHFDVGGTVLDAFGGDHSVIQNSVIEAGQYTPFFVGPDSSLTFLNDTLISRAGTPVAIRMNVSPGDSGSATAVVKDSIVRGFAKAWELEAPFSPADGDNHLSVSFSNLSSAGTQTGDGTVSAPNGVINEDPDFEGLSDYHLSEGSPSVDASDPAAGGLLTDFDGAVRPLDGNGDGTAVRDQGAFEAPALVLDCPEDPSVCPVIDSTGPRIGKVRFRHGRSPKKGGRLKFGVDESAAIKVVFKPVPKGRGKKKRKVRKFKKVVSDAADVNIRIKKGKLRPGKYRLTIKATDDSGNRSKPFVKKVRVKGRRKR